MMQSKKMSLFPAYSKANLKTSEENDNKEDWLTNSSFKNVIPLNIEPEQTQTCSKINLNEPIYEIDDVEISENENISEDSSHEKRRKKHKKHKKTVEITIENPDYKIDKKPERIFLTVRTISRPAVSKYIKNRYYGLDTKTKNPNRYTKYERYYYRLRKIYTKEEENTKITESESKTENDDNNKEKSSQQTEESSISQKTCSYNQELGKNPFNIEMWLEYIKFQDVIWSFEKLYKKGSVAKGVRATAERKISIIDRALVHNPGNVELLRERLRICESVYPADELRNDLRKLVDKDPGWFVY